MKLPKKTKGDVVYVKHPTDREKILMAEVLGAEITERGELWWYTVRAYALAVQIDDFIVAEDDLLEIKD